LIEIEKVVSGTQNFGVLFSGVSGSHGRKLNPLEWIHWRGSGDNTAVSLGPYAGDSCRDTDFLCETVTGIGIALTAQ
jgi:hypothetical protein